MHTWVRSRVDRLRAIRVEDMKDSRVLAFLLGLGVATSIFSMWFHKGSDFAWWDGFTQNFSTEVFGAFMTFYLLEKLIGRGNYKRQLLREVRSRSNDTAISAVDALREEGWLEDWTLEGHEMPNANLQGANLEHANLRKTIFEFANLQGAHLAFAKLLWANLGKTYLQGANLAFANLYEATLIEANLQGASFANAGLQGADLSGANLAGAELIYANLQGASLGHANLQGADLRDATFDEETILPDKTKWSVDIDMEKFTNPNHAQFRDFYTDVPIPLPIQENPPPTTDDLLVSLSQRLASLERELTLLRAAQKVNSRVPGPTRTRR